MKYKVIAPGRVNLIGEHTDYNQGFVLPAAIGLFLELTCEAKQGRNITATAEGFSVPETFSLDTLAPVTRDPLWIDYLKGVCWALEKAGHLLSGADISIHSNLPTGSGLSSSAALELATAKALTAANGLEIPLTELALICQQAENEFVKVRCGIMDQYAVALGRKNHALLLDCRSLDYKYIPLLLGKHCLLIIDSRVERSLGSSVYNRRREECEETVRRLSAISKKEFNSLREVTLDDLKECCAYLPDILYRRGRFVVEENIRVQEAAAALQGEDLLSFGYFMKRSHAGLRDLYEVSCPELDLIVDTAVPVNGVLGARMTGAGFGGCVIVLLERDVVAAVTRQIEVAFTAKNWCKPYFYTVETVQGIRLVEIP